MSMDSRLNDIHEYRLELQKELERIRHNKSAKFRIKEINIELDNINRQLTKEKRIAHLEGKLGDVSGALVEALKEYVTKEQFLKAVEKANKQKAEYNHFLEQERKSLYGYAKEVAERQSNRNVGGYFDRTASQAINNVERRGK